MNIQLQPVAYEHQLKTIANMAVMIWNECYTHIISQQQIDYMLERFQSFEALQQQIKDGYIYYFITYESEQVGFIGVKPDQGKLFLSKLYLIKEYRGKGVGSMAISLLKQVARQHSCSAIWLTVNRYNDTAITMYKRNGFINIREQVADIGNGYVMDDYVMELTVPAEEEASAKEYSDTTKRS